MPPRRSRRRALAAPTAALVLGVVLAGCAGDSVATPTTTPLASPAASPTATPSPTPTALQLPTRPEAMATNDEAGAVAAAQYFITDLYDYVFASGDVTEWSALSDDGCNFCNSILVKSQEMTAAGESAHAGPSTVESTNVVTLTEGSRYAVTIVLSQGESRTVNPAGETVGSSAAGQYNVNFAILRTTDWSILAVDAIPITPANS